MNWSKARIKKELKKVKSDLDFHREQRTLTQREIDRLNIVKKVLEEKLNRFNPSQRKP